MGSTGENTFSDYAQSGTTRCDDSIDASLEDVGRLDYFSVSAKIPKKGTRVRLRAGIHAGRLVVEEYTTHTAIGHLPTRFHYLALCQKNGYSYEGEITSSRAGRVPTVEVHLDPV
jgi:hypothetical protein